MLRFLERVPPDPLLFFAVVNYLGGVRADFDAFRAFVLTRADDVIELIQSRRTQANEVGRCSLFLPAIGSIEGPIALIEVGSSAGLNLLLDQYSYDYGPAGRVGEGEVVLRCEARGPVPVPRRLPDVIYRRGIDVSPVDVRDEEAVRWLEACVWPGRPERMDALRGAVEMARSDPPEIVQGDLVDELEGVLQDVPVGARTVIFHSMVLIYVSSEKIARFTELVYEHDVEWLSFEAPWILPNVRWSKRPPPDRAAFLGRNGRELVAYAHPHGRWIEWLGPAASG